MLKLYYTTTVGEDALQPRFDKSLGGYRSSSPVKNDMFDNFFAEISNYTLNNDTQPQYIGLILKNEDLVNGVTGINAWFEYPTDSYSKIEIAAVDLSVDTDGFSYMENIPSITSSPLYATFYEADGQVNQQLLGDIAAGQAIGIWLKRTVLKSVALQDRTDQIVVDPNNANQYVMTTLNTSDTIAFKLDYT